jgi:hypothetical protein
MSRSYRLVGAASACLFVSACGGGGGGSVATIPPPPPPPPQEATAFPLTASGNFDAIIANRSYRLPGGTPFDVDLFGVAGRNSGVSISYDASSGSYSIKDAATSSAIFSSASRTSSGHFDTYTAQAGTVSDTLRLYDNVRSGASQAGAPITLKYLSFGDWSHDDSAAGTHSDTYFLIGYPTDTSEMPRSGSASYSTLVTANIMSIFTQQGESRISGSATFSADFGAGTVSTALTLPLGYLGATSSTYNGTGLISGNQFSGDFKTSDDPYFVDGDFAGGFFGPSAAEMGYTFTIERGSPDPYAGATTAPPLSWTIGTVVGTKSSN